MILIGIVIFCLSYFHFWVALTWSILSFVPMYANRVYLHNDPPGSFIINAILMMLWHILNMFMAHWVITKVGFLYIDAEVLHRGND